MMVAISELGARTYNPLEKIDIDTLRELWDRADRTPGETTMIPGKGSVDKGDITLEIDQRVVVTDGK